MAARCFVNSAARLCFGRRILRPRAAPPQRVSRPAHAAQSSVICSSDVHCRFDLRWCTVEQISAVAPGTLLREGCRMFEQEMELERGKGGWGPMLLVVVLVGCIVGGIGYYVYQMKKGLSQEEASSVVTSILTAKKQ